MVCLLPLHPLIPPSLCTQVKAVKASLYNGNAISSVSCWEPSSGPHQDPPLWSVVPVSPLLGLSASSYNLHCGPPYFPQKPDAPVSALLSFYLESFSSRYPPGPTSYALGTCAPLSPYRRSFPCPSVWNRTSSLSISLLGSVFFQNISLFCA